MFAEESDMAQSQLHGRDVLQCAVPTPCLPHVSVAQKSKVVRAEQLLDSSDRANIAEVLRQITDSEPPAHFGTNTLENTDKSAKHCTFLHRRLDLLCSKAPGVLDKVRCFAAQAYDSAGWGHVDGPLANISEDHSLRVRVAEHWEYRRGGKLDDPWHYDGGSVMTVVVLLHDDFVGGAFCTHESDGTMLEHPMRAGDAVCFVSHKYHNVSTVIAGVRRSLVVELWDPSLSLPFLSMMRHDQGQPAWATSMVKSLDAVNSAVYAALRWCLLRAEGMLGLVWRGADSNCELRQ